MILKSAVPIGLGKMAGIARLGKKRQIAELQLLHQLTDPLPARLRRLQRAPDIHLGEEKARQQKPRTNQIRIDPAHLWSPISKMKEGMIPPDLEALFRLSLGEGIDHRQTRTRNAINSDWFVTPTQADIHVIDLTRFPLAREYPKPNRSALPKNPVLVAHGTLAQHLSDTADFTLGTPTRMNPQYFDRQLSTGLSSPAGNRHRSAWTGLFAFFMATMLGISPGTTVAANALAGHPSPYLALHAQDPVHWQEWGPEVLARAKAENKLLFLSSGYFACHWCHVMQRESFRDPEIAALINRHLIPVKIDRELEPALDAYLIDFARRIRGQAGWPLNVFLTPDGYPLAGLLYSRPEGLRQIIERLAAAWGEQREYLGTLARQAADEMQPPPVGTTEPMSTRETAALRDSFLQQTLALADELSGGFGQGSRFPMEPQWLTLLELIPKPPAPPFRKLVELSLDQMATQGLRDHLGGGFFRYTVDPGWQQPHFEKMLYTNALMARLYLRAAQVLERPDYLEVARDTLDFLLRELRAPDGGCIASLSAVDGVGVEGGYYLWSENELAATLTPEELVVARRRWGLEGARPFPDGWLPVLRARVEEISRAEGITEDEVVNRLHRAKTKLLAKRQQRSLPRDGKRLAGWNGLALSALVAGAQAFPEGPYRQAAGEVRDWLLTRLWDGRRLWRAKEQGRALGSPALEDFVYTAAGLLAWAELSGQTADKDIAVEFIARAWSDFFTDQGWKTATLTPLPAMPRAWAMTDNPLPSPSALLIRLTAALPQPPASARVSQALGLGALPARQNPFDFAGHVLALWQAQPR